MNTSTTIAIDHLDFMQCLVAVEQQLLAMADVLISGDAVSFEGSCGVLQSLMLDFSQAYKSVSPEASSGRTLKDRLRVLGQSLAQQRENMVRRAVAVDRELQVILPSKQGTTYGRPVGSYGQNGCSAGRHTSIHA